MGRLRPGARTPSWAPRRAASRRAIHAAARSHVAALSAAPPRAYYGQPRVDQGALGGGVAAAAAAAAGFGVALSLADSMMIDCSLSSTSTIFAGAEPPPNRLPRHNANQLSQSYKRLGTVLGEGAYGIVEMGRQNRSGDLVAIKSVTCHDPHERDALERELVALEWVLAHGGHPGLLHLMDIYSRGTGTMMIVSELCPGGELFDKLVNEGPMSERAAAHLTKSLAGALHFLHNTCGWAHGDMKPENVMLNNDSNSPVTLVDLGSAHPKTAEPSCGQIGTTAYWSPESFSNAKCCLNF